MEKDVFLLCSEYKQWLAQAGIAQISLPNYLMQDVEPSSGLLYFDIIASFLFHGERSYAYSALEEWGERTRNSKNKHSYWRKYRQFIRSAIGDVRPYINPSAVLTDKQLAPVRKHFNKKGIVSLDGMEALEDLIGTDNLIRYAIENSFFFDSGVALDRFKQMADVITRGLPDALFPDYGVTLPARHSKSPAHVVMPGATMWYVDANGCKICPIKEDHNGNSKVHSMIYRLFGYNLNVKLEDKPLSNYITSHIWGEAIDPRYFTSLWNIVLVPAWANHLLDKQSAPAGSLASKFRATIMEVCTKHNQLSAPGRYRWSDVLLPGAPAIANPADAQRGTYNIQVICKKGKGNSAKFGTIVTKRVRI